VRIPKSFDAACCVSVFLEAVLCLSSPHKGLNPLSCALCNNDSSLRLRASPNSLYARDTTLYSLPSLAASVSPYELLANNSGCADVPKLLVRQMSPRHLLQDSG
jgi:hypothetical protein